MNANCNQIKAHTENYGVHYMLHHTWLTYYRFKTLEIHVSTIEFRVHIEHEDYIAQALSVAWIQNQVPTNF